MTLINSAISIVIPTYNEAIHIEKSLTSIFKELEKAQCEYEVIVVDNMSTDTTEQIAKQFNIEFLTCQIKGCPAAVRNVGALHAKHAIICFVDGDCTLTENWFEKLFDIFNSPNIGAYGGPCLSPQHSSWVETTWAPIAMTAYYNEHATLAGSNMTLKKEVFLSIGGFNETLITAEDDDLSKRILAKGWKVIDDSAHAVIHWGYPNSLEKIFKQQVWHGSSQLKAHGFFGDKILILTFLWLVSIVICLSTLFVIPFVSLACLFAIMACPLLVSIKRIARFKTINLSLVFKSYVISYFFLAGRSWGLLKELFKNLY